MYIHRNRTTEKCHDSINISWTTTGSGPIKLNHLNLVRSFKSKVPKMNLYNKMSKGRLIVNHAKGIESAFQKRDHEEQLVLSVLTKPRSRRRRRFGSFCIPSRRDCVWRNFLCTDRRTPFHISRFTSDRIRRDRPSLSL
jgi:hypothetical protein